MAVKKDNVIGFAMQLDVTDLKAGLQETKKAITTANKEFNASVAGMDNWQDSILGVSAKLNHLDTVLRNQKKNLAGYEKELENAKKEYGENSEQVRRLQDKLLDCKTAIGKTEKAQRKYTAQLEKVQSEHASTITSVDELKDELRKLDSQLSKDKKAVSDYESALEDAKKEHGETSKEVNDLMDKLTKAKRAVSNTESAQKAYSSQLNKVQSESAQTTTSTKSMANALRNADSATVELKGGFTVLKGIMANLASNVITSVVSGLKNVISESREFRSEMSFLQATADKTGSSFDQAQEKVKEVYSVLGETDSAVEGMNNLMTAGFDGEALDEITDQLLGASIQWHDTLKFEGLADGLQETLATGKAVGPFVELLERGGMVAEDFDEGLAKCKTDAEKQNYVLQTLSKLGLAEVTEGYKESNKSLVEGAEAQFEYEQAMASFGEKTEPMLTAVKKGVIDILNAFMDLFAGANLEGLKSSIEGAFKWFVDEVVPIIKEVIKFVIDNKDVILALIAGIGAGFAAWKIVTIIQGIITATKAWWIATEGVTLAQKLLNVVMSANPIGLVITAVVALVAAFVVLWKKSDAFRNFWINLWDKIKDVTKSVWKVIKKFFVDAWVAIQKAWSVAVKWFQNLWNGIKKVFMGVVNFYATIYGNAWKGIKKIWSVAVSWFQNIWNGIKKIFLGVVTFYATVYGNAWKAIKNAWSSAVSWFRNIWSGIKNVFSAVGSWFGQKFRNAWNNVKSAWSSVSTFFSDILSKIKKIFTNAKDTFKDIGKDMMNGLKEGINSKIESVKKAVKNGVEKAVDGVKSFLGINSPSKLMRDEVGAMMGEGVGVGLLDSTKTVLRDATKFADSVVNGISSKVSDINVGLNTTSQGLRSSAIPVQTIHKVTNYSQTINSPKALTRKEIYMKTKNLLSWTEGQ